VTTALVLSAVLAIAALVDQVGTRGLAEHAVARYASYGIHPDPTVLYGAVYAVAVVDAVLWLLVLRAVRSGRRSALVLAGVVTTTTAAVAALVVDATEYGQPIFPPLWGVLAALPPAAGVAAVALLLRRPSRSG
jgi:hypothetical protein